MFGRGRISMISFLDNICWREKASRVIPVLIAGLLAGGVADRAAAGCADVALVLALDASGSITDEEFASQIDGYVAALTSDQVLASFAEAGVVDVAAVFWGDSAFVPQIIPWLRITGAQDAVTFASEMRRKKRSVSGNTDIGVGIHAALELFREPGRCAERRVIDISGDGVASVMARRADHVALAPVRQAALDEGVVINALAIASREPKLAEYYRRNVAGGIGAFVMEVADMAGFARALSQKLRKELLAHRTGGHPCQQATGEFRCLPS